MQKDLYIKKLEEAIKQMLNPIKDIPLKLVIKALSGFQIIPFNKRNEKDLRLLAQLKQVAVLAGENINFKGIKRKRPNEVGNDTEIFVREALNKLGLNSSIPKAKDGKIKNMGYPDIEFIDKFKRINYLECKTFNIDNIDTKQRSFYLSPSENFKINCDAHHFLLSFEIYEAGRRGDMKIYKCKSWKLLTVEDLCVDVKYEFNADNDRLYNKKIILAEGKI